MAKDGLDEKAEMIRRELQLAGFDADYDDSGTIGRRYARADEIGVPVAITVDYDTLKDDSVTLRDRASWKQVRAPAKSLTTALRVYFEKSCSFSDLGVPVSVAGDS
jgi:glycyl-tRNA synthetase